MSNGINSILLQLAEAATTNSEQEKQAFVPMPGGAPMDPAMGGGAPMDPAMMGGGAPMDPSMMGGAPMDPAMMGGGMVPPTDPMAMAAQGADPAAIMAAQGAPVDPMMAAAGGADVPSPPAPEQAPAEAEQAPASKGGSQKEKLDEIHGMLTKILGVLVGKGLLGPEELGGIASTQGQPEESGISGAQKVASVTPTEEDEPAPMGDVVLPAEKAAEVKKSLASLIMSLGGK